MTDLYSHKTEGYEVLFTPVFDATDALAARDDAAWSSDREADMAADREHAKRSSRWEGQW